MKDVPLTIIRIKRVTAALKEIEEASAFWSAQWVEIRIELAEIQNALYRIEEKQKRGTH